jgi:hypothetical protein
MIDTYTDRTAQRSPRRAANKDLPASPSKARAPAENETLPSAGAKAPASMPDQKPTAGSGQRRQRAAGKRVRVALLSMLSLLLMAGAYWYVTAVMSTGNLSVEAEITAVAVAILAIEMALIPLAVLAIDIAADILIGRQP